MNKKIRKKKVAIIGTNGIPARYGGFETLAEYLTMYLGNDFSFYVYCSNLYKKQERVNSYNQAKLVYLPFKGNGVQSLIYDLFSFIHALFISKTILYLGVTPSGIITAINIIFRRRIVVNHGGLNEWEREKYSNIEKKWAKINHRFAAKRADVNISDNSILKESIQKKFKVSSLIIRYGGNHSQRVEKSPELLKKYNFANQSYCLCVARAQVDNNLHLLINSFSKITNHQLVIVSNWNISDYGTKLKQEHINDNGIILLDAIYDRQEIDFLRSNCNIYIHSHSYCGTSPSLVEVMSLNIPIICFDVPTNRETTQNSTFYFKTENELINLIQTLSQEKLENIRIVLNKIAEEEYTWEKIASQYSQIL